MNNNKIKSTGSSLLVLSTLPKLQHLYLDENIIYTFSDFNKKKNVFPELEELHLAKNRIDSFDELVHVAIFPKLKRIAIKGNPFVRPIVISIAKGNSAMLNNPLALFEQKFKIEFIVKKRLIYRMFL